MDELDIIVDFHKDSQRQGPGSDIETIKALDLMCKTKENIDILDIGCGTGSQTMVLAENSKSYITAIDIFPEFLDVLNRKIKEKDLASRVVAQQISMDDLPFKNEQFDLIWSEGAIYIIGFEKGLTEWRRVLKPEGYLVVTEMSWLTNKRPYEIEKYWTKNYSQIDTISNKIKLIEENGYIPTAHFILPKYCWLNNYYEPNQERMESFLEKHKYSRLAEEFIKNEKKEVQMYKRYKDYYGYVFYIARKKGELFETIPEL